MLDPQYLQQETASDTEEELSSQEEIKTNIVNTPIFSPNIPPVSPVSELEDSTKNTTLPPTKICLKFQMNNTGSSGAGQGSNQKKVPLKSPLMPTSCTTTSGSVNLTYNFPAENLTLTKIPKIPIGTLSPVPQTHEVERGYELPQILTIPTLPPNQATATPPILIGTPVYDQSTEELYSEEILNANVDMALYSPLPHLHFPGQASTPSGLVPINPTPLEDWIKQPNNLTLSSDALMASLQSAELSAPSTPISLFSDQTLPPFSSSQAQVEMVNQGFALPPLENTLDLETVDLEALPS